jgi:hypothetical protein
LNSKGTPLRKEKGQNPPVFAWSSPKNHYTIVRISEFHSWALAKPPAESTGHGSDAAGKPRAPALRGHATLWVSHPRGGRSPPSGAVPAAGAPRAADFWKQFSHRRLSDTDAVVGSNFLIGYSSSSCQIAPHKLPSSQSAADRAAHFRARARAATRPGAGGSNGNSRGPRAAAAAANRGCTATRTLPEALRLCDL